MWHNELSVPQRPLDSVTLKEFFLSVFKLHGCVMCIKHRCPNQQILFVVQFYDSEHLTYLLCGG